MVRTENVGEARNLVHHCILSDKMTGERDRVPNPDSALPLAASSSVPYSSLQLSQDRASVLEGTPAIKTIL